MAVKNRQFWESARFNNQDFRRYYNRLTELSMVMFKWTGLPDTIDSRYLELVLFSDGRAVFFEDETLGYLTLKCAIGGTLDVYRVPTFREAIAENGYHKALNETDSVIIFNNLLRHGSRDDVEAFSRRLWNIDRTIDVNINAQKTPVLIICDENQRLTMKNLYMKYEGNEPVIYGDKNLNPKGLTVLKTDAPYVADRLIADKNAIWNEALTYLGISNVNYEKRERLVSDEVMRSQGGVLANRYSRLVARQNACEEINRKFGLDIWCEYRDDFMELTKMALEENNEPYTKLSEGDMGEGGKDE